MAQTAVDFFWDRLHPSSITCPRWPSPAMLVKRDPGEGSILCDIARQVLAAVLPCDD